jgi:predicted MFS family arabinose efflux permease
MVITGMCFLLPHWRWASVGTALAAAPIIPLMFFFVPESPVWLESQRRIKKQQIALNQIAFISDVEIGNIIFFLTLTLIFFLGVYRVYT